MIKLSSTQSKYREDLLSFCKMNLNNDISDRDYACVFSKDKWKSLSKVNIHGLNIPSEYGGNNLNLEDTISAFESLGYASRDNGISFAALAQLSSCTNVLSKFSQNKNLIRGILDGEIIIAHGMTESSSGSDAFNMKSKYRNVTENNFSLNISKTYSTNLPIADYLLTYAQDSETNMITAFLIPKNKLTQIKNINKMGLNTCLMGSAEFKGELNQDYVIGKIGQGASMFNEAIASERILMSALHMGTIERLIHEVITWTKTRKSKDNSLSDLQSISHPIVDLYEDYTILRNYLYTIGRANLSFSKLYLQASIINDKVAELYTKATVKILQIYGGLGYTKNHEIERMVRDSLASKIYSGTSQIQKEIIWKLIKH